MNEELTQIIRYQGESYKTDFKKEEYPLGKSHKRNEILKDFISFANNPSNEDKYIIIGVKESNGSKEIFPLETLTDESKYQQFINDNIEPKINFEYKELFYNNQRIAYFRIFENLNRPYLFKKDVVNPENSKSEYKYGDGYLRIGSSTRKIGRIELDDIIKSQNLRKDRRNDITVEPIIGISIDREIFIWKPTYIDIRLINKSNKSIELDIEMEIMLNGDNRFNILSKPEFITKHRQTNGFDNFYVNSDILHLDFQRRYDKILVTRNPVKNKTAIILPQNSEEKDVFCRHLIVTEIDSIISATVTVRSDDFVNGALVQQINFEFKA